jgi:phosphatidylglycerophosphatase C
MWNKKLYVFDFDGTLTTRDTLIAFIRFARGTTWLLRCLLRLLPWLVLMKLHLADNGRTKERLFSLCFKGMELATFNDLCSRFAVAASHRIIRQDTWDVMQKAIAGGSRVFIVSASIDNWVKPFFNSMGSVTILGTQIETKDNRLTGRFLTPNCYGAEKVRRLKEAVPGLTSNRRQYDVIAFGDSRGDKEMFEYADESYYIGKAYFRPDAR